MSRAFLGKGWRFPILPDDNGQLGYSSGPENIEHSLKVLLLTSLGERVMRYDFGCQAASFVFAPGSHRFLRLLENSIRDSVRDWEPRIELLEVLAETDPDEEERVNVSIAYRIRATNTQFNLVFPYYLDSNGGRS